MIKFLTCITVVITFTATAQDTIRYTGETISNIDYHHGQLQPAVGVHNIQVMRANRQYPEKSDGYGWTYNHAPNLVHWNGTFYLQYLSDPVGEHEAPGQSFMVTSEDGYSWSMPTTLFPIYRIPDGITKPDEEGESKDLDAVMHQRMGFYISKDGLLLTLGYYGISLHKKDGPNDGNGVGRVIREIKQDGTLGPVYFIRYNHGFDAGNTNYPFYKESENELFVKACDEILSQPLLMQQWVEEADRDDPLIPLQDEFKAFSYYHLEDGRTVGLWKHALTSMSDDGGQTWQYKPTRAPGFVNSNAKIWGQKTSDGKYVTVYNPSEFRWPLALSVSEDGLEYDNLLLVNGEITSMRYGGNYKSYGPQYVRGILPENGSSPDDNIWVSYSMNKEDMWLSKIPVPITGKVDEGPFNEVFNELPAGEELANWNIYSPLWAPVRVEAVADEKALVLSDKDPFDYAKAERVLPPTKVGSVEFDITPKQNDKGLMHIELQNAQGNPAIRLLLNDEGQMMVKAGYRLKPIFDYEAGETYNIRIEFDVPNRVYEIFINGEKEVRQIFFQQVSAIERLTFRTGEVRRFPNADTPTDQDYDLENAGEEDPEASWSIKSVSYK